MTSVNKDIDDWDTDPDFERHMSEAEQRWGSKRTIGSINMNELIKDVTKDHERLRERFGHQSQKDHSVGFGGDFGIQTDRKDQSAMGYDYIEKLSKHTSQETSTRLSKSATDEISKSRNEFMSKFSSNSSGSSRPKDEQGKDDDRRSFSPSFQTSSVRDRINNLKSEMSNRMESLKKEMEQSPKLSSQNSSEQVKKSIIRDHKYESKSGSSSIKSLSEKFESMGKNSDDQFRRVADERRHKYFDEIQGQVDQSRRQQEANIEASFRARPSTASSPVSKQPTADVRSSFGAESIKSKSPTSVRFQMDQDRPRKEDREREKAQAQEVKRDKIADDEKPSATKAKLYSVKSMKKEEIVTKIVKEGDRVVEQETKRHVESSHHESSSDEADEDDWKVNNDDFGTTVRRPKIDPKPKQDKSAGLMGKSLYDYQAADDDELSFDVGETITNIEKLDPGWYKGQIIKNGTVCVGLFPANYVQLINDHN